MIECMIECNGMMRSLRLKWPWKSSKEKRRCPSWRHKKLKFQGRKIISIKKFFFVGLPMNEGSKEMANGFGLSKYFFSC